MSTPRPHHSAQAQPDGGASQTYDELVAAFVATHPESVAIARANIARWLTRGVQATEPLRRWDELLAAAEADSAGFQRLLVVLAGDSDETRRLLEFSPFAGVLPRDERRKARDLCGYRH